MTPDDLEILLEDLQNNVDLFSAEEIAELQSSVRQIEQMEMFERARTNFLTFVKLCGPPAFKTSSHGQHHKMAKMFEEVVDGDRKRLTIAMPPRFGKSSYASIFLPAWFIGKYPHLKCMQISAKEDLATDFGRKVKGIIESPAYQRIFPGVKLSKDSKSSGKFAIASHGGEYFALGITSAQAGKGGDLIVVDDPTTEQEARTGDPSIYENVWNLFQSGARQRLQSGGRIIIVQTRWSKADLIGKVTRAFAEDPNVDNYHHIVFPALDPDTEMSTFPEVWSTDELRQTRANLMKSSPHFWYGPYQQNPTSSEASMIPATAWRKWDKFRRIPGTVDDCEFIPPECHFVLMAMDTAESISKRANPTACTVWGLFDYTDQESKKTEPHVILLHSYNQKMEFHNLKRVAKEWVKEWKPDCILVEPKSTGPALRSELAEAGIFTEPARIKPGEDKRVRLASVADVFHSGRVHYIPTAANQETISQCADYPNAEFDDLVDCVSHSLRKFRSGGLVSTNNDHREPIHDEYSMPPGGYY